VLGVLDGAAVVAVVVVPELEVVVFLVFFVVAVAACDDEAGCVLELRVDVLVAAAAVPWAVAVAEAAEPAMTPTMASVAEALATPAIRLARRAGCRRAVS